MCITFLSNVSEVALTTQFQIVEEHSSCNVIELLPNIADKPNTLYDPSVKIIYCMPCDDNL